MSVTVEINPPDSESLYLESLNACFGHWGDEAMFRWAFGRTAGSHSSDRMLLRDETGTLLAGSAVSYRRVRGAGHEFDVGIMTGSWTLPPARGQGCFTRIIEESRLLSEHHGCALLLAFVTWDNASRRRLEDAGSRMIGSRYIFTSDTKTAVGSLEIRELDAIPDELWGAVEASRGPAFHFCYPARADFVGQCVQRPHPVEALAVGSATVLVERAGSTDRISVADLGSESVEHVFTSVAARAHGGGRRFFGFAMGEHDFAGLECKEGFLTALVADSTALGDTTLADLSTWHIDSGDRM